MPVTIPDLGRSGVLTTKHARSSRGLPILLLDGIAYNPNNQLPGLKMLGRYPLRLSHPMTPQQYVDAAKAGWLLSPYVVF